MFKNRLISCICLSIVSFVVFFNSLNAPFMWDDSYLIVDNQYIRSFKMLPFIFSLRYWRQYAPEVKGLYRPIRMITLILDYSLWKLNPFGYHLTNLLLHIFCVILIYFLVSKIINLSGFSYNWILKVPFLTAFLFAIHPVHTESVVWIKNRSDLLTLIFFTFSFIYFINFIKNKKVSNYIFSLFFYILALFSKEMAFMIPFVFLVYCFCFLDKERLKSGLFIIPFFITGILHFAFEKVFLSTAITEEFVEKLNLNIYQHIFIVIKTLGYYIRLLFFPINLCAEIPFKIPLSFFEKEVFVSTVLLIIVFFLFRFFKFRLITFGLLWFFITILPASNIIFLKTRPIAEQRLYIPSLGFCLLLAIFFGKIFFDKGTRKIGFLSFTCLSLLYSGITIRRNFDWRNPIIFWERTIQQGGITWRVFYNLGNEYFLIRRYKDAITAYQKAIELNPYNGSSYLNLGVLYRKEGKVKEAIDILNKGLISKESKAEILFNLGSIYKSIGDFNKALECLEKSIEVNSDFDFSYNAIGDIYYKLGNLEKAFEFYKKAIQKNPYYLEAYNNIGTILLRIGKIDESIFFYNKALSLKPDYPYALYNLGVIYINIPSKKNEGISLLKKMKSFNVRDAKLFLNAGIELRKINEIYLAIDFFEEAIRLNPFLKDAYYNLIDIYTQLEKYNLAIITSQKVIELNLADFLLYNNLGKIYNKVGNYNSAIFFLNKAIELKPDYIDAYLNLAFAKYQLKLFLEVIDIYKKILEFEPNRGDIYYNIGMIYYNIKNFKSAFEYLTKAVNLSYEVDKKILEEIKSNLK